MTTHSHLEPMLRKRVGLYLFGACSRVNFTFTFITGSLVDRQASNELLIGTVPLLEVTAHITLSSPSTQATLRIYQYVLRSYVRWRPIVCLQSRQTDHRSFSTWTPRRTVWTSEAPDRRLENGRRWCCRSTNTRY